MYYPRECKTTISPHHRCLLTYCLKVHILEPDTLRCLHLIPIPKPHDETIVAAVPTHEIILVNQENSFYVPSDRGLIRDCKHLDNIRICKRTQPSYLLSEMHSCECKLIKSNIKILDSQVFQISIFQIQELVYIPLYGDNQYILIPEETTEINTICDDRTETITLSAATYIAGSNCRIQTPKSILKLSNSVSIKKMCFTRKMYLYPSRRPN